MELISRNGNALFWGTILALNQNFFPSRPRFEPVASRIMPTNAQLLHHDVWYRSVRVTSRVAPAAGCRQAVLARAYLNKYTHTHTKLLYGVTCHNKDTLPFVIRLHSTEAKCSIDELNGLVMKDSYVIQLFKPINLKLNHGIRYNSGIQILLFAYPPSQV
jgi:hypothetical protein